MQSRADSNRNAEEIEILKQKIEELLEIQKWNNFYFKKLYQSQSFQNANWNVSTRRDSQYAQDLNEELPSQNKMNKIEKNSKKKISTTNKTRNKLGKHLTTNKTANKPNVADSSNLWNNSFVNKAIPSRVSDQKQPSFYPHRQSKQELGAVKASGSQANMRKHRRNDKPLESWSKSFINYDKKKEIQLETKPTDVVEYEDRTPIHQPQSNFDSTFKRPSTVSQRRDRSTRNLEAQMKTNDNSCNLKEVRSSTPNQLMSGKGAQNDGNRSSVVKLQRKVAKKNDAWTSRSPNTNPKNDLSIRLLKALKELWSQNESIDKIMQMLLIFVETLFSFKYASGKHNFTTFKTWTELKKYILANGHYFISEVKYVQSKVEHGQFNVTALTKLRKEFNTEIKTKFSSANPSCVQIYQFLQNVFDSVKQYEATHKKDLCRVNTSKEILNRSNISQQRSRENPMNQRSIVDFDKYINVGKRDSKKITKPVLKESNHTPSIMDLSQVQCKIFHALKIGFIFLFSWFIIYKQWI